MRISINNSYLGKAAGVIKPLLLALLGTAAVSMGASAQDYPERDVELLVGFAAGGPTDAAARMVAAEMGRQFSTNMVVVNRTGAGGEVAAIELLRRKADGYSLLLTTNGLLTVKPAVYTGTRFKQDDFELIGTVAAYPHVLLVSNASPAEDVKSLIEMMKSRPDGGFSASASNTNDLTIEWLKSLVPDLSIVRIPYRGASQAVSDLITNRVDMALVSPDVAAPLLDAGKVRALAVTSATTEGTFSSYPTIAESYPGLENFDMKAWSGIVVKKGTPGHIVRELTETLDRTLKNEEIQQRLAKLGMSVLIRSPSAFKADVDAESQRWKSVAERSGVQFN